MKTFLSLAAAVIALALTGIKLTSGAYPEAQALVKAEPAEHRALVRMNGFRV
jgi:hypothetical protein